MNPAPATHESVSARAPGKINLLLRVGPRRPDGYHDLVTCFHAVDLWETVTVTPAASTRVTITGDVNLGEVPLDDNNLVVKAARQVGHALGIDQELAIHIDKRVPVGGGMGGGSADAAAALLAANRLWNGELGPDELLAIAATLGADVPFALEGMSQIGRGNGSELSALRAMPLWWVVVPSIEQLHTPEVYAVLDDLRAHETVTLEDALPDGFAAAVTTGDAHALAPLLHNDLQPAAIALRPSLEQLLERGQRLGALASLVSGSGPTCVMLAADQERARAVSDGLSEDGLFSVVVQSPARGAHLV